MISVQTEALRVKEVVNSGFGKSVSSDDARTEDKAYLDRINENFAFVVGTIISECRVRDLFRRQSVGLYVYDTVHHLDLNVRLWLVFRRDIWVAIVPNYIPNSFALIILNQDSAT